MYYLICWQRTNADFLRVSHSESEEEREDDGQANSRSANNTSANENEADLLGGLAVPQQQYQQQRFEYMVLGVIFWV